MPVSRPSSTGPPQAGQLLIVTSRFAPQLLHFTASSVRRTYPAATSALNRRTRPPDGGSLATPPQRRDPRSGWEAGARSGAGWRVALRIKGARLPLADLNRYARWNACFD